MSVHKCAQLNFLLIVNIIIMHYRAKNSCAHACAYILYSLNACKTMVENAKNQCSGVHLNAQIIIKIAWMQKIWTIIYRYRFQYSYIINSNYKKHFCKFINTCIGANIWPKSYQALYPVFIKAKSIAIWKKKFL